MKFPITGTVLGLALTIVAAPIDNEKRQLSGEGEGSSFPSLSLPAGTLPTGLPSSGGLGGGSGTLGGLGSLTTGTPSSGSPGLGTGLASSSSSLGSLGSLTGSSGSSDPLAGLGSGSSSLGSLSSLTARSGSSGSSDPLASLESGSSSLGSLGSLGSLTGASGSSGSSDPLASLESGSTGSTSGGLSALTGILGGSTSTAAASIATATAAPAPASNSIGSSYPNAPASDYSGGSTANDVSDNTGCRDMTFIFARGTTETGTMGTVVGPPTAKDLISTLGANAVSVQGLDYPAIVAGNADEGKAGGATMAKLAQQALKQCPKTKLVLSGYSQGAMVVHQALGGLSTGDVSAVVVFGDPLNGQAWKNIDASKVLDVCGSSDFICDHGPTDTSGSHLSYGSSAQKAAGFAVKAAGL